MSYEEQIETDWKWKDIDKAMDVAAERYRATAPEDREDFTSHTNAISVWAGIPTDWDSEDSFEVSIYIGSSLNIIPSGKFYMPWSTNVTEEEAAKDEEFMEAFEKVAAKHNMYQKSGEGDPLDWYLCRSYDERS